MFRVSQDPRNSPSAEQRDPTDPSPSKRLRRRGHRCSGGILSRLRETFPGRAGSPRSLRDPVRCRFRELVVGEAPLLYFLADRQPFLREPWIELVSIGAIQTMVDAAERQGRLPRRANVSTELRSTQPGQSERIFLSCRQFLRHRRPTIFAHPRRSLEDA